eukprot:TRINITY_DN3493_c0_g1_i1.p1 TRINITY_DN3493_c0_g1~~TRINITY_DN3493_c0_g1_i1.p1  ORF type:complete len:268 (+),score=53.82 TRINITY_DN3493_c0_g1_i1:188-991(+)
MMGNAMMSCKTLDNQLFYDPELFPKLLKLQENYKLIADELEVARSCQTMPFTLKKKDEEMRSDVEVKLTGPSGAWCGDDVMNRLYEETKDTTGWLHWWSDKPDKPHENWTIFGLIQQGQFLNENCKQCPNTVKLLKDIPEIRMAGFSRLLPKTDILPHVGFTGRAYGSLAFHLGLSIPQRGCGLKVGHQIHHWRKPGEVVIFDDTFPHCAWNKSEHERIILYIDFKIPEDILEILPPLQKYESSDDEEEESGEEVKGPDVNQRAIDI